MSDDGSKQSGEEETEVILQPVVIESSEDPPMDEWSSLEIGIEPENPKRLLFDEGLFDPGDGEICANYIAMSASSILRHPYYWYPAITDPGIRDALLKPENPIIHPDDGQSHYLSVCNDMKLCPIINFHKGLLTSVIDLKYYGVDPRAVRAMAIALKYNKFVKVLDLTDNFLTVDSAYHLGDMLRMNNTLEELNLSGCRIGPDGVNALLTNMISNKTLEILNLGGNELGDAGVAHVATAIFRGLDIKRLDLRLNKISGRALALLSEAFETHNKITHWNLSWNNLYSPGTHVFIKNLSETTKKLESVDLSWNSLSGLRIAQSLQLLLLIKSLHHLDLSNNKLEGESIRPIVLSLRKATGLRTLDLSYNPMSPKDCLSILKKLKLKACKVTSLFMDNVVIDSECMKVLTSIRTSKPQVVVTVGHLVGDFIPEGPDFRALVFNRLQFLCTSSKAKPDLALFLLQLRKDRQPARFLLPKEVIDDFKGARINVDGDLLASMGDAFPGPKGKEGRTIDFDLVVEYVKRLWPDKKLPPTPPPEIEETPPPKGKKKGKKK